MFVIISLDSWFMSASSLLLWHIPEDISIIVRDDPRLTGDRRRWLAVRKCQDDTRLLYYLQKGYSNMYVEYTDYMMVQITCVCNLPNKIWHHLTNHWTTPNIASLDQFDPTFEFLHLPNFHPIILGKIAGSILITREFSMEIPTWIFIGPILKHQCFETSKFMIIPNILGKFMKHDPRWKSSHLELFSQPPTGPVWWWSILWPIHLAKNPPLDLIGMGAWPLRLVNMLI